MTAALPNRSARILGEAYHLTAAEMNLALRHLGFLEGTPGAYSVTEKGLPFAVETFKDRGTGGYPRYNPSWVERTWRAAIQEVLDITPELKELVRAEAAAFREQRRAAAQLASEVPAVAVAAVSSSNAKRVVIITVGTVVAAASLYATWKSYQRRQQRRTPTGTPSPE